MDKDDCAAHRPDSQAQQEALARLADAAARMDSVRAVLPTAPVERRQGVAKHIWDNTALGS